MSRATVDLRPVAGEEIFIRLVDQDVIGWGHLNFDDFRFHATTPVAAAAPAPATAVNGAIDLLKLINPRRDAVAGRWKWDTKAALITGDRRALIGLPIGGLMIWYLVRQRRRFAKRTLSPRG